MTADVDTATRHPRRRRRLATIATVVVGASLVVLTAGVFVRGMPTGDASGAFTGRMPVVAPDGVLDLSSVTEEVAAEFHYASRHLDVYQQLRCWCGCEEAFDHADLADCFVRPDGKWEAHGAGCAVCVASAIVARERLEAGVPIDNIAAEIDRTFGPDPDLTEDRT